MKTTKRCKRCLTAKPLAEFYTNDKSCKPCRRAVVKKYREANPRLITERKRRWKKTPAGKRCVRRWEMNPNNIRRKLLKKAHEAVRRALKSGKLIKGPCEHKGQGPCNGEVHGHHPSYDPSKWLVVTWLCQLHHELVHQLESKS